MDCSPKAPLSMEFSRQGYWCEIDIPFSRGSSQPRDQTWSPELQADSLVAELPGKKQIQYGVRFAFPC